MTEPTVAIVDAYSTARYFAPLFAARGLHCVHVQSTPRIPAVYAPSFRGGEFVDNVVHHGDLDQTVMALARHRPAAVVAGIESGVELADRLSERLGVRSNGTARSPARRDKFAMVETVKAAGIRHIKLHAARHTCATLMHLQGVPVAVIAAWIGHKDASTTMKIYAHSQSDALKAAGAQVTRKSLLAALHKIDKFDGNGMLAESGPASKRQPVCNMFMRVQDGKFVRVDPLEPFAVVGPHGATGERSEIAPRRRFGEALAPGLVTA